MMWNPEAAVSIINKALRRATRPLVTRESPHLAHLITIPAF